MLNEITSGNDQLLFPGDNPEIVNLEVLIKTGKPDREKGTFPIVLHIVKAESLPVDTIYQDWKISELQDRKVTGTVMTGSKPVLDSIDIPNSEPWERQWALEQVEQYLENDYPSDIFKVGETLRDTIMQLPNDVSYGKWFTSYTLDKIVKGKAFFSFKKEFVPPQEMISSGEYNSQFDDLLYFEYLSFDQSEEGNFIYDISNNMIEEKKWFTLTEAEVLRFSMSTISKAKIQQNYSETIEILSPKQMQDFIKPAN